MRLLNIVALTLYTFGAFAFGAMAADFVRTLRGRIEPREGQPGCRTVDLLGGLMVGLCFLWFANSLVILAAAHHPDWTGFRPQVFQLVLVYLFPPLIAHLTFIDARGQRAGLARWPWVVPVVAIWLASITMMAWSLLAIFGRIVVARGVVGPTIGISIGLLFAAASIHAVAAMTVAAHGTKESRGQRAGRLSMTALFGATLVLVALLFISGATGASTGRILQVVAGCLPLLFIFTDLYHANRFEFFDLFVKRGAALILTFGLLGAWFALVLPLLEIFRTQYIGPWLLALAMLPLALALPWVHGWLGRWVDHVWLGRRFTTVDALKEFLAGLHSATGEHELVLRAESGLAALFQAQVRIDLDLREAPREGFEQVQEIPIRSGERHVGVILMGRRDKQIPYFSQDLALLRSLADVFSSMLENVRLQAKKQEQEQRASELAHQASLSELKALRAQINPHFLFNALNAIAGLIHKDPFRADATVEQLAEVFRYTLRGSEKEWARLEDELEFVEAYLAVERARFGERLCVRMTVDDAVKSVRIPTMVVQTLVENAIKHGVASVRGEGRVELDARPENGLLVVEVADNGPGFSTEAEARPGRKGASFGLKSVRERFQGYFGDRAELSVSRDPLRDMTVVRVTLPLDHGMGSEPARSGGSAGAA